MSSTATRQGGGAAGRGAARRAAGGAKGAGGRTRRDAMKYATDNRLVSWVYDFTTGPKRYVFYLLVALFVGMGVYSPVRDFYIAHRTEAILQEQSDEQSDTTTPLARRSRACCRKRASRTPRAGITAW